MAGPFRRVLVGWDGSADAAEALSVAAAIAGRDGGHVVALAVVRPPQHPESGEDDDRGPIRRLAEEHFDQLRRQQEPASAVRFSVQVIAEDGNGAGRAVCDYAAVHGFDLLVLGRHGDGVARGSRLGRVADAAAHVSPVPLLLLSAS